MGIKWRLKDVKIEVHHSDIWEFVPYNPAQNLDANIGFT